MTTTEKLRQLAQLRQDIAGQKETNKRFDEELRQTMQYNMLTVGKYALKSLEDQIEELTAEIKAEEIAALVPKDDGYEKPTTPGIALRVNHKIKYAVEKATEWEKENAQFLLVLDTKAFEKTAKSAQPGAMPFVKYYDEPQITIATDLSEYLGGES